MRVIRTILGDIAPEALGITASHEHLWCDQTLGQFGDFPGRSEPMHLRDLEMVLREVGLFKAAGGRAIVEVTCDGWGRDMAVMAEISRRTGLHVIATAGYYIAPCHPEFVAGASIETLTEVLVRDVLEGADCAPRAGLLKAAVGMARIEGDEEKCIRAVARAHHRTEATITTHTSASARFHIDGGNAGTMFLDLFEEEGVPLDRVIIGHTDENADIRQLRRLLARDAWVQFDVIGKEHWLLDETRADLLAALVSEGHGGRLLLSGDRNRVSEMRVSGGKGYDYLLTDFVPILRVRGIPEREISRMLVDNPADIFSLPVEPQ